MPATPLIVTGKEAGWHRRPTGHRGIKITFSGCGLFAQFGYLFEISGGFLETIRPYFRSACEAIRYQLLDFYPTGAGDGLTDSPTLKPCEHIRCLQRQNEKIVLETWGSSKQRTSIGREGCFYF